MYYKDVEEEIAYKPEQSPSFGTLEEALNRYKTPIWIFIGIAVVVIVAFLIYWFLIREREAEGFKYY